ncbi:hypothetical protein G8759_25170 [Spirosoma aureum]|uniref:Uncharacterized protein n=1 Tax=Spirosoma aureum TaxID=2692134 RepID=A0A6G9ATH5_9BACT|nr:hypothetical protein [Spirosoma aureum]QIP15688.1 hypothetical protein G8759_25170 [Spirosoma aureum]
MPLTTDEAFETLVNSEYYWSRTGLSHQDKRNNRFKVNKGKFISTEKKEELLARAGFAVNTVTTWQLPKAT